MDAYDVLGGPVLRTQLVPAPGAGADWTFTIPGRAAMEILGVVATLTTAVAVATRLPRLVITDGSATVLAIGSGTGEAASLVQTYCWAPDIGPVQQGGGGSATAAIPRHLTLPAGFTLGTTTSALQAADMWTAITIWTREKPNYGEGAETETPLWRAAQRLGDIASHLEALQDRT